MYPTVVGKCIAVFDSPIIPESSESRGENSPDLCKADVGLFCISSCIRSMYRRNTDYRSVLEIKLAKVRTICLYTENIWEYVYVDYIVLFFGQAIGELPNHLKIDCTSCTFCPKGPNRFDCFLGEMLWIVR